jgi:hypothetical protein
LGAAWELAGLEVLGQQRVVSDVFAADAVFLTSLPATVLSLMFLPVTAIAA